MSGIVLERLVKRFGGIEAVRGIDLTIADGELTVLVGPSGCGKTTTLRMIAGLEPVTSGHIRFDGEPVEALAPKDRDIAMVFQSYALYPHMTVRGNLGFGLRMHGVPSGERRRLVEAAAALLGISDLLERKPRELSGGQRQRVAMGRAIVRQPRAFLFDEPLSNLDAALRAQMRIEIKKLHRQLGATMVYVTHDQIEAMTLADRIVVMSAGRIEQTGRPMELYRRPANRFVAAFIGSPRMNFLPLVPGEADDGFALDLGAGARLALPPALSRAVAALGRRGLELGIRPEHLRDAPERPAGALALEVEVDVVEPMGTANLIAFQLAGRPLAALGDPELTRRPGERVTLWAEPARLHLFDAASGEALPLALPARPHPTPGKGEHRGMIVDHRTYTLKPLKLQPWLELYETYGLPVQVRHLGGLIGFFVTEVGTLNQVVHLWSFASLEERQQRRAAMAKDPDWAEFLRRNAELAALDHQENKILVPVSFSPIK